MCAWAPAQNPTTDASSPQTQHPKARQAPTRPFLAHCYNRPQGESYCYDGIIKDCRAVEERASSGATTTIRIECGAGCVCRSLQRERSVKEEDASSFERQGPSRNPPGAKSALGKSQGREEVAAGRRRVGFRSAAVPAAVAAGVPPAAARARLPRDSRQDAGATFKAR